MNIEFDYSDIINLPHHVSKKHPQMSIEARSAQFAPFAALTGYGDAVNETARLTDKRIELDDVIKEEINCKLETIKRNIKERPIVTITYFVPDTKKQGGAYVTVTGSIYKIDENKQQINLNDGTKIPIEEIISVNGF